MSTEWFLHAHADGRDQPDDLAKIAFEIRREKTEERRESIDAFFEDGQPRVSSSKR